MRSFIQNLSNSGFLILSGLTIKQARQLKEISKQFGLKVIDERKEADWGSLLLKRTVVKHLTYSNVLKPTNIYSQATAIRTGL